MDRNAPNRPTIHDPLPKPQVIDGKTKLLGVMGYPVEHSLSPVMHNAAIAHLQINYVYLPFPVCPDDLSQAIKGFEAIGVVGVNLTIPHKQAILPHLTEASELATAVGAVNTIWQTPQGWSGTNTDVAGFLAPLQAQARDWAEATVLVLGNGGAARAVVAGCAHLGVRAIQVAGRTAEKLQHFQKSWPQPAIQSMLSTHTWESLPALIPEAALIVNTTPIGMAPHIDASPLAASLWQLAQPGAIAYDLIYTPRPTRFLQDAQRQGLTTIDGMEMLVQQGAAALKLWIQHPVPIDIMRTALENALAQRS
ncbi:shikimate dehydrogenase [Vacuolonema iberomarrocanum]|uniref:shikimate dehydrogenase n=1 Tax=Vacuolonema iberomarrocanum TaxID=3454632 RepID=UPI001A0EC048|nr:shikimate dehydrogenase [filamentous cyanobacterium LEGE 07170]